MKKLMKIFVVVLVFGVGSAKGVFIPEPVVRDHAALMATGYVAISSANGFDDILAYEGTTYGVLSESVYNDYDFQVYNPVTELDEFPSSKFYFTTTGDDGGGIMFLSAFDTIDNIVYPGVLFGYVRGPLSLSGLPVENIYGVQDIVEDGIIGYVNFGTGSLIFGGNGDVTITANDLIMDGIRGNLKGLNGGAYTFGLPDFIVSPMVYSPIPEPLTIVMLAVGGLIFRMKKRQSFF